MAKKKRGIILWFSRLWEPHGHKRKSTNRSGLAATVTGGRMTDDRCCTSGCCMCILVILIITFGGFFGMMAGFDTDVPLPPDEPAGSYYQMQVDINSVGGEFLLAAGGVEVSFNVEIYTVTGGVPGGRIEYFLMSDIENGASVYDYSSGLLLFISIYNADMAFEGDGFVHSNEVSSISILHWGEEIYTASISWLLNGAGIIWG